MHLEEVNFHLNLGNMEFLNLKIGGTGFVLLHRNLQKYPDTFLSQFCLLTHEERMERCDGYFPAQDQYFFDRSAVLFENVALLYRMDVLIVPSGFCKEVFVEELRFWAIDSSLLTDSCSCQHRVSAPSTLQVSRKDYLPVPNGPSAPEDLAQLRNNNNNNNNNNNEKVQHTGQLWAKAVQFAVDNHHKNRLRMRLWSELNMQAHRLGKAIEFISLMFIILTVVILCTESFKDVRKSFCDHPIYPKTNRSVNETFSEQDDIRCHVLSFTHLDMLDITCVIWFTFEFALFFWAAPVRLKFVRSPLGIIDVVSIVPVYVEYILKFSGVLNATVHFELVARSFFALRILRALRVVRILKIARYSRGLQVIGSVFQNSFQELMLVFVYTFILTIFFATLVYYAEFGDDSSKFKNIPIAAWWAVVTLTTLGYGDIVPSTEVGKIIAAVATMSGVVLLAFPISIIVERFTVVYAEVVPSRHSSGADRRTSGGVRKIGKHIRVQSGRSREESLVCN